VIDDLRLVISDIPFVTFCVFVRFWFIWRAGDNPQRLLRPKAKHDGSACILHQKQSLSLH
jgi:hypothetical protein